MQLPCWETQKLKLGFQEAETKIALSLGLHASLRSAAAKARFAASKCPTAQMLGIQAKQLEIWQSKQVNELGGSVDLQEPAPRHDSPEERNPNQNLSRGRSLVIRSIHKPATNSDGAKPHHHHASRSLTFTTPAWIYATRSTQCHVFWKRCSHCIGLHRDHKDFCELGALRRIASLQTALYMHIYTYIYICRKLFCYTI